MPKPLPSQERLRELLDYCEETGKLTWKPRVYHIKASGKTYISPARNCGSEKNGYLYMFCDGVLYLAHRIIWKLMTGYDPELVDHRDGKKNNNAWSNLRNATHSENNYNCRARDKLNSCLKGVSYYHRTDNYYAHIVIKRKKYHLGVFETEEEAHAAYVKRGKEEFGEFFCDGKR